MSDSELELSLENENISRSEERVRDLSAKAKAAYDERDAAKADADATKAKLAELEGNLKFTEEFSGVTSKFPQATELKDKIREKVKAGYSTEDATVAVLNAEGKLTAQPEPRVAIAATGGSAPVQLPDGGVKRPGEMSQVERRAALEEAVRRGDITVT